MSVNDLIDFFQIYHDTDQPAHEQCMHETAEKCDHKEDNYMKDATNKKCAAVGEKNPSSTTAQRNKSMRTSLMEFKELWIWYNVEILQTTEVESSRLL